MPDTLPISSRLIKFLRHLPMLKLGCSFNLLAVFQSILGGNIEERLAKKSIPKGKMPMDKAQIKLEALNLAFRELEYLRSAGVAPQLSQPSQLPELLKQLATPFEEYLESSSK